MNAKEIKAELLKGAQFANEVVNWFTVCRPGEGVYMIAFPAGNRFYKNIDSYSKRVAQLINRGY